MPPHVVSLLQVGDVHFPYAAKTSFSDWKDRTIRSDLVNQSSPNKLTAVVRLIQARIDRGDADALILVGDLTTYGCLRHFEECIKFVVNAFLKARKFEKHPEFFRVLPGNHDLRRKTSIDMPPDEKFGEFIKVVEDAGLLAFPIETIQSLNVGDVDRGLASLWLANSCVGCGDLRRLPKKLKAAVEAYFQTLGDSDVDPTEYQSLFDEEETIDTPLIAEEAIESFVSGVASGHGREMLVFCAHHNLLPQYRPRVSVYGEMLNAGYVRRRLLDLKRPIIYLHGHVHCDAIETIRDPINPSAQIISIGAPLAQDGFNIVKVGFGENGTPLGVRLVQVRVADSVTETTTEVHMPLWSPSDAKNLLSGDAKAVLARLPSGQDITFQTLQDYRLFSGRSDAVTRKLSAAIDELDWLGLAKRDAKLPLLSSHRVRLL
jgi:hypothetical protein